MAWRSFLVGLLLLVTGCTGKQPSGNPSFPLSVEQAQRELKRMETDRKPLERPLIILNGFLDPGFGGAAVSGMIRQHTSNAQIIAVSYPLCFSFDACRLRVIEAVDRAYPSDDPKQTRCVDVIGLSMGGLLARYCAIPHSDGRRLHIARLFTVSSPNQGARRAQRWPALMQMQVDMRPESPFLKRLEEAEKPLSYEIVPYTRLGDYIVGAQYAAPGGRVAWWVPNEPMQHPHVGASSDPRIMADILRRLRGEKSFTQVPPAPVPHEEL